LGVPDITTNAATLAKLAPITCLTHLDHPDEVEIAIPGSKCVGRLQHGPLHLLFASNASPLTIKLPDSVVLLLPTSRSEPLQIFSRIIQSKLEECGVLVKQSALTSDDGASLSGQSVISLLEVDLPLVYSWDEDQFLAFKEMVSKVKHLFWITHGSVLKSWSNGIEFATSQGLFRVMRNEYPMAILPSLDLSAVADISSATYADLVLDVWRTSLDEDADMEYAEGNGVIYIPRATESAGFDYELQLAGHTAKPILNPLGALGKPLKATKSANAHGCVWTPDELAELPLQAEEIDVKVEYAGVGAGRTLDHVRHAVGVVSRRGDSVTRFELGQRVLVFTDAAARTNVRQSQAQVVPLPNDLEPQDAVALVEPLVTAQYALVEMARLAFNHSLLLDNAANAVGQALIQVAKAAGADIFALVNSREERDMLVEKFGIPTAHIFDSELGNFVPIIQSATQNRGVDVVVSQQSGAHVARAMSLLNDFGQFLDIDGSNSKVVSPTLNNNVTFIRIDMVAVLKSRPDIVRKLFQQAFKKYVLQGPSHLTVLPVTSLSTLVHSVQTEQSVVSLRDDTPVLMPPPPARGLELDSEAVYVLVGGLGALGLDIANWMVGCGAKNLVFLSRSGGSKNQHDLQKMAERSVRAVAFKADINDAASVAQTFDTIKSSGRRIAGVIQLAMVLQDGIFDNMSFDQWRHAIEPKTMGSRNLLANLWPNDKPFFILLSSITGIIGNTAQANYASGNTFEDALAHHARAHLGINATSIDVGLVSDSSHFTKAGEFGDLASYLGKYQHGWRGLQTNLEELGILMRAIMRGSTTTGQSAPAQIVLGLGDRIERNKSTGGFSRDKKFELRVVNVDTKDEDGSAKQDVGTSLANASSMREAAAAVEEDIKELIAISMGVAVEEVDSQKPLFDYGGKS
jgi:NADPH:quinone reductase-like Zn-dependent oxidoreductase/NADP-dependent 3-hydroxy acid dehydrogenase YdfG